ncbi:MAG: 4Fe-4S dicluster domain-containing protein [Candidatus Heteroscillospira sp.]|jgi:[FeFe] hydrogenase (group B1/B3)
MRGIHNNIGDIRRNVFAAVAKMAYDGNYSKMRELPFDILPGEDATYRDSIFVERAIVSERVRLACGLPLRSMDDYAPTDAGIEESAIAEKYYTPPLVNIIKFACNACPEKRVVVTDMCQGCLAHPCMEVCPKGAVSIVNGRSHIDPDKCIKCGKCIDACEYNAIIKQERPCAKSCGMNAIHSDDHGRAEIDYDKCVSCGMCMANCPFGAIADKSQLLQVCTAIRKGDKLTAIIAPAFVSQFEGLTPAKLPAAMRALGFQAVKEVAIGADLCTIDEAADFTQKVPGELPFMATSCCPAWSVMVKKLYPDLRDTISMALTPMVLTARMVKRKYPDHKICFVGPCAAKKLEAMRRSIRSDVDFVLTYEELAGMFEAKNVDFSTLEDDDRFGKGTAAGRGFAVSGGVANAVVDLIKKEHPEREVQVASAQGLDNCRKMMAMAKAGKYNGYLLEGMACPGGCVGGAGTITAFNKAAAAVGKYKNEADKKIADETEYADYLELLLELEDDD